MLAALSALLFASTFAAESVKTEHARVSWVAPESFESSKTSTIGLRFELKPGWHVYWRNPGDSGSAPKFNFKASGAKLGEVQWPAPERLPYGYLTNLGYDAEVVFPLDVTTGSDRSDVQIDARLEWLVCNEGECVPGFGDLTLNRPIAAQAPDEAWNAQDRARLDKFRARVPHPAAESPWEIREVKRAAAPAKSLTVEVQPRDRALSGRAPEIFPLAGNHLSAGAPVMENAGKGYRFTFEAVTPEKFDRTGFVLADEKGAWQFDSVPVEKDGVSGAMPKESLGLLLLFAFLGGMILNLMPCVLPVLSIKFFSLVRSEHRVKEALIYSAGVLVAFAALGAGFLGLRAAGAAIGWGFHLQSPVVVLLLIVLFWLMGLNFSGYFEMGTRLMGLASRGGTGSFATGLLSVFVAAPCTGPFMGSALGAAATLPGPQAILLFLGLGAGLASPFLAVAATPAVARRLPKPGAWMERLKEFFAFPLFGTVLWLLWVLDTQTGPSGALLAGSLLLLLSFSLWLGRSKRGFVHGLAWILALASIGGAVHSIRAQPAPDRKQQAQSEWQPYSKTKLAALRAEGKAVFVDFTAAWCISCQVNKKAVLDTEAARELFRKHGVTLLEGDWTNADPEITDALAEFGRSSVPLYVYYGAKKDAMPVLLPQVLTISDIDKLFN